MHYNHHCLAPDAGLFIYDPGLPCCREPKRKIFPLCCGTPVGSYWLSTIMSRLCKAVKCVNLPRNVEKKAIQKMALTGGPSLCGRLPDAAYTRPLRGRYVAHSQ